MRKSFVLLGGFGGGAALLVVSGFLVSAHLRFLTQVREGTLPLASEVPPLEQRLALLHQQLELTDLQASLQSGSPEEKLHAYVLPEKTDLARLLGFFDVTRALLERGKMARAFSAIEIGDAVPVEGSGEADGKATLLRQAVTFHATLSPEGTQRLLDTLALTGLLTVGDTLTQEETDRLFLLTESENYAGIVAVEKFLGTDLASYAREPRPAEDQLLKAFSSERFLQEFRSLLSQTRLKSAREILGGDSGAAYDKAKVWPVQLLTQDRVSVETLPDGWNTVSVTLGALSRTSAH